MSEPILWFNTEMKFPLVVTLFYSSSLFLNRNHVLKAKAQ